MKTRVVTRDTIYEPWEVQVYDPFEKRWSCISIHETFFIANLKAWLLSRKPLTVKQPKKEHFLEKLNGTYED